MSARTGTPALVRAGAICVNCARGARSFAGRYQEFLLDPGTLFTVASLLLLIVAAMLNPGGLVGRGGDSQARAPFYLAAALVGSVYIWWSAIQGIRVGDFTADIPVSIATAAALIVQQYSAAAVVSRAWHRPQPAAVLLLLGGMLEEFVAALLPAQVTVRRNGRDVVIRLGEVVVGDLGLVRSGERIAVDGEVVSGTATVNQAAITGESMPVDKVTGDKVFACSPWGCWALPLVSPSPAS